MRTFALALAALACLVVSPAADANNGKGKGKGKGKGGADGGDVTTITGAGQRLHFSFGGELRLEDGKLKGHFAIISHPLAPASTSRLTVACKFREFKKASLAGPRLEFEGKGECGVLETSGRTDKIEVKNKFIIIDDPDGTDQIDVEFIGASGIMIPGGDLEFGRFTFTTTP
jgi:hypothetical protein